MYVQCERKEEGEGLGMRLLHRTEIHLENSGMESCCISFRLYNMSKQVNHVKNGLETLHGNWTSSWKSFFNPFISCKTDIINTCRP